MQSRVKSVPGEAGAFYASRKFANAGKDRQTTEIIFFGLFVELAADHFVNSPKSSSASPLVLPFTA